MKYGELSERILRKYYGGTIPQNNRLQQEDIDWLIVDAANYLIRSNLYQAMQQEGRRVIDPLFIQTYPDVPILYDDSREKYYIELPASPIALNRGLSTYEISFMMDDEGAFVPLPTGWSSLSKHSPAKKLEGNIGIGLEGKNAYFIVNFEKYKDKAKFVLVKMIGSLKNIDSEDEMPIPDDYFWQIIDLCVKWLFEPQSRPDALNDRKQEP
jgi:hypothetical protein